MTQMTPAQTRPITDSSVQLSAKHTAILEKGPATFKPHMPVIVVLEDGRRTPGQWYADTIADSYSEEIFIDFGANWRLDRNETAILQGFARGVVAALLDL